MYYEEYKNFFVSFKQNTFQKRMGGKKENKTDQHNKLAQQVQERKQKKRK